MPQSFTNDYSNKRMKEIGKAAGIEGLETITRHSGNDTHVQSIKNNDMNCYPNTRVEEHLLLF